MHTLLIKLVLVGGLLLSASGLMAQKVQVPSNIKFAGLSLNIKSKARNWLEREVTKIIQDTLSFRKKVATADLYLPLVREILEEANLPEDFQYLALIDNSAPDSLLFWQMAREKAFALGLRVNSQIDERENILAATRAVSRFLELNEKKLHNWLFTLLSYHLNVDGVQTYLKDHFPKMASSLILGAKEFDIDLDTHPDILKFLALDLAYRPALGHNLFPETELVSFREAGGKSFRDLSQSFALPESKIRSFNPWLKSGFVPRDKEYEMIIPMPARSPSADVQVYSSRAGTLLYETEPKKDFSFNPQVESQSHVVKAGETLYGISRVYGITVDQLRQWNGLNTSDILSIGQRLKIQTQNANPKPISPKIKKEAILHTVQKGETLYRISRAYQVPVEDLKQWNKLFGNDIYIGQKLIINVEKETEQSPTTPIEEPKGETGGGSTLPPAIFENPGTRTLKTKVIPDEMYIGGIRLRFSAAGKKALKKEVDRLVRHPEYFFSKTRRADLYLGLVRKSLIENGVPADFQYLPIQESELIADAVSSSKAVGYWQFKAASAKEVGIEVSSRVDERMNIVASSTGAASYLLRNQMYFDNWVFSLLSFNMGFTGAKNYLLRQYRGKDLRKMKEIEINQYTHWYIMKFLAHKVAFENELGLERMSRKLDVYTQGAQKSLNSIAREKNCEIDEIKSHNQWLKRAKVPSGKQYSVILPLKLR